MLNQNLDPNITYCEQMYAKHERFDVMLLPFVLSITHGLGLCEMWIDVDDIVETE